MYGHWRVCLNLDVSLLQQGVTALFLASQCGHTLVITCLLEHGAQVDLPTDVSHSKGLSQSQGLRNIAIVL